MKLWRNANLILPNRSAVGLAALLLAMWYAGASQSNGAAYLLCFVVASIGLLSLPHTWANLRGVRLRAGLIKPVFAGEHLSVPLIAETYSRRPKFAVRVKSALGGTPVDFAVISAETPAQADALIPVDTRGIFNTLNVRISSTFPLGFFTGQRWAELRQKYVVYPKPVGGLPLPVTPDTAHDAPNGARSEGDDYAGVRSWIPGESMRQIDWKAVSRGLPLMTKQWTGEAVHRLMLDFDAVPLADTEAKLSQLARWIVDAETQGYAYGLKLRGERIDSSSGSAHYHRCLEALASFEAMSGSVDGAKGEQIR